MSDQAVISTIKKVLPAVVSIVISKHLAKLQKEPHNLYSFLPGQSRGKKARGLQLPGVWLGPPEGEQIGGGSGFIVDESGLILTDKHVVSEEKADYTVILNDNRHFPAKILSRDPIRDIAILKIDAGGLPTLTLGDSGKLELGQGVIAIGNALGVFKNTVSLGIISGLSRAVSARAGNKGKFQEMRGLIQTDAAINPGNSGGPLTDLDGNAVGINAVIISNAQSIGFAIPINPAKRDLADIQAYGKIRRPLLGLRYITVDEVVADELHLPVKYGALVIRETPHDEAVIPGGPAHKAGIREKDIVLSCNDTKVSADKPIEDILENVSAGDTLRLRIWRNGKEFETQLTLAERK
ncbi:MAG: trypsin-like peptidase domain-containing protein [Patescibacteria group bacterium]